MISGALALIRADLHVASSYRVRMALSLAALLASIVPVYFVAKALQPTMARTLRGESDDYFAFLIVGMVALSMVSTSVRAFPQAVEGAIRTGTLEALFASPAGLPTILTGMTGHSFLWTGVRALILLGAAWVLGAPFAWERAAVAGAILLLIVMAHVPFGLLATASVLVFRTAGPLPVAVIALSGLLGGVYYPTHVIPSWFDLVSGVLPLTYGLRAARGVLLEGAPFSAILADASVLGGFAAVLMLVSVAVVQLSLRHAKRMGTLGQY